MFLFLINIIICSLGASFLFLFKKKEEKGLHREIKVFENKYIFLIFYP